MIKSLWCKFLKWIIKVATTTYDLSSCCCFTPGDDCTNCNTGTMPASVHITTASNTFSNADCSLCTTLNSLTFAMTQNVSDHCLLENNSIATLCNNAGGVPGVVTGDAFFSNSGGHYFLTIEISVPAKGPATGGDLFVFKKDLGTTKPDCSTFSSESIPYDHTDIGSTSSACSSGGGAVLFTSH